MTFGREIGEDEVNDYREQAAHSRYLREHPVPASRTILQVRDLDTSGSPVTWEGSLEEFRTANIDWLDDDPSADDQLNALKPDDAPLRFGGGAAPMFSVEAIQEEM